jgi:tetratricopeptide (TPR) repeat protein
LVTALALAPHAVAAEEPSVEDVKAAGEQFNLGRTAFKDEDYAVAAEHFERADGLAPNAKVLELAIQSREQAGQIGRAAMLAEVAKRRYPDDERFADVGSIIERAERDYARVDVTCDKPCILVVGMRLIHGQPSTDWVLFLESGEHEVRAGWGDQDEAKQYSATAGESGTLAFEAPVPKPPPPEPTPSPTPQEYDPIESPFAGGTLEDDEAQRDRTESKGLSPTWFWIGAGTTVALAGVSTWSGFDTLNNPGQAAVREACRGQGEACPEYKDGVARQNRTNLLWGITGGVAVGTAVVFALTDFGGDEKPKGEYSDRLAFAPWVGIDSLGASAQGSF